MSEYGLLGATDEQDHTYEWGGDDVTIRLIPPTLAQIQEYEALGADAGVDQLREVIDRHIVQPDHDAGDMTLQEVNCYIGGIMDHAGSGGSDLVEQAQQYAEEHGGGN